ncbi:NAD(P)/FAD-dependent oxidoreductase [Kiloniella laminariae]|uniref:NAD(P)/FAD-dependent oxidoreductase n=1 Tax=Kiloniella laminariae TaxID=454162 RepID=A0ABT4LNC1_9PROT|nr:NAD(P)/FAD-dependent oxidoreductase [Kiloniella laminariae]MCZ4282561.1 NAD(P)/FAD-dependent oxidoreductase [Kiloniella laminariae]
MQRYDHIIVGSGINALVAAAMLSGKGDKVLILERSDVLGGCLRTEEITLPGYHHDVMAATFVLFLTSPAYAVLGEDLARHGLEFCHTAYPTAVLCPDGSSLVLSTDRSANVQSWNDLAGGDGDCHAQDVGNIEDDAAFLFALLGGRLWSWSTFRLILVQAWRRGPRGLVSWIGQALVPARAWLEATYKSPLVQALWAPWVLHAGLTPSSSFSGQMGKVIAFALEAAGAPVVKGGAGGAVAAFRSLIEERGGVIRTGIDVDKVIVENGQACGVVTSSGERVEADNVSVSVAPGQLYQRLLREEKLDEEYSISTEFRHGRGNFQLHYALEASPEWIAEGLDKVALIHLCEGIDAVSKSANEAERGLLPEVPTICVGQPHQLDPSRCPAGKAILWIQVPDAPRLIKGDAAGQLPTTAEWTESLREAFADRIESILSNHIKDFKKSVLKRRAYSPADLAAININLVGGDPYGGSCEIDQFFVWRPFAHSVNSGTTIKNLHHIGASTHPGPGLGGGSGYLLAKRMGA